MRNYSFFLRNKAPLFGQITLFVLSRPLWERLRGSMFFFVISSRPKWKERISFPSVPQDRHSIPMWKPVNGWERTCHLLPCFQLPSAMGERERSFHASNPSCCLPSTRYAYKWFFCKRICQMFFLGNCRQSYILNKEYLGKNRRIFGFFQTGWEGLPPDSHFHCFLCFLNWHGQLQEDFYPFFSGDRLKSSAWYSIEGESTRTNFKWTSRLFLQSKIISPTSQIQWFPQYYPR